MDCRSITNRPTGAKEMEMRGIYHLSPCSGLKKLRPSMPAEDIIAGQLVWAMDTQLPASAACVCCGTDPAAILDHNPMLRGYIYEPLTSETPRIFFAEAARLPMSDWLDSVVSGEVRFYRPVRCRCVGTFTLVVTPIGLRPKIVFFKSS